MVDLWSILWRILLRSGQPMRISMGLVHSRVLRLHELLRLLDVARFRSLVQMPWTASDAERHTHKATTLELKELWAKVANEALERTSDEGRAIREANAVIARQAAAKHG